MSQQPEETGQLSTPRVRTSGHRFLTSPNSSALCVAPHLDGQYQGVRHSWQATRVGMQECTSPDSMQRPVILARLTRLPRVYGATSCSSRVWSQAGPAHTLFTSHPTVQSPSHTHHHHHHHHHHNNNNNNNTTAAHAYRHKHVHCGFVFLVRFVKRVDVPKE